MGRGEPPARRTRGQDHEGARAGIAEPLCLQRQAHLRGTAQLSTGMCIKAKAAVRWNAGTASCTAKKGKQGGCDSPTVYSHELDRILARVFEQMTDERSTAVQGVHRQSARLCRTAGQCSCPREVEQEISRPSPAARTSCSTSRLPGHSRTTEFRQRNEACNEQLAAPSSSSEQNCRTADKTLEERIRRVENLRRIIEERWQMRLRVLARDVQGASLTISSWTRTRAKPVSRSIFSSPPVQSRSYLKRKPLTHSCK